MANQISFAKASEQAFDATGARSARQTNRGTFDRFAEEYTFWMDHHPQRFTANTYAHLAHADSSILDVGCGDGRLSVALARHARYVTGIDLAPAMIARAKARGQQAALQNLTFHVADLNQLDFAPAQFDLIVCSFVLHHTDQRVSIPRLIQLLRPGGSLYLQEPLCPIGAGWARGLWFRGQGMRQIPAITRQHGFSVAWRVARFLQSRAWIEHQLEDDLWTPAFARAQYAERFPGAVIEVAPASTTITVLWQRPESHSTTPSSAPATQDDRCQNSFLTPVHRTYAGAVPAAYIPFPRSALDQAVPVRFEEQVVRYGERSALRTPHAHWSYNELNATANRLAHRLLQGRRQAMKPVAVIMDQEEPVIPTILGILKSGQPYVVIDPVDPPERQARILQMVDAAVVVSTAARQDAVAHLPDLSAQLLIAEEVDRDPTPDNPTLPLGPHQLAAIFFTSGSTGEPKGIVRDHRQFLHSTWLNTNTYYVAHTDRQSLLYFPGFTASVPNIYDTLLNGATLCALNPRYLSPFDLLVWLQQERITHFNPPIGLFRSLLEAARPELTWPELRLITLAGQPLYGKDVRDFQARFGAHTTLLYVLAMTEAGAITQAYIDQRTVAGDGAIPAGYPVADKAITVVDEDGQPVASGIAGQIVVTSPYLSLGQWDDLRAKSTQAQAAADEPVSQRLVTSDRGRFGADGALEFLGRADFVVKIRGYRVELGAIEAVLNSHPQISSAAVVVDSQATGHERLLAYLVPIANSAVTVAEIRPFLAARVPVYMVPEHIIFLQAMPLTASGKVERANLPAPTAIRPELSSPLIAPRTALEQTLAHFWADLLSLDGLGVADSFFELGGDSITLMKLLMLVKRELGQDVDISTFLQQPTITSLAAQIMAEETASMADSPGSATDARSATLSLADRALVERNLSGRAYTLGATTIIQTLRDRIIPFDLRIRLFRMVAHNRWLSRHYVHRVRSTVDQFLKASAITQHEPSTVLTNFLMRDLWRRYGQGILARQCRQDLAARALISGSEHLQRATDAGHGIILLSNHTLFPNMVLPTILEQLGYTEYRFYAGKAALEQNSALRSAVQTHFGDKDVTTVAAKFLGGQLNSALPTLSRNGIVQIAADGLSGSNAKGVQLSFLGRQRLFMTGFAELALHTGATVIPIQTALTPTGQAMITCLPALDIGLPSQSHAERVQRLVRQYVAFLEDTWELDPGNCPLTHLQWYLQMPLTPAAERGAPASTVAEVQY